MPRRENRKGAELACVIMQLIPECLRRFAGAARQPARRHALRGTLEPGCALARPSGDVRPLIRPGAEVTHVRAPLDRDRSRAAVFCPVLNRFRCAAAVARDAGKSRGGGFQEPCRSPRSGSSFHAIGHHRHVGRCIQARSSGVGDHAEKHHAVYGRQDFEPAPRAPHADLRRRRSDTAPAGRSMPRVRKTASTRSWPFLRWSRPTDSSRFAAPRKAPRARHLIGVRPEPRGIDARVDHGDRSPRLPPRKRGRA